MSQEMQQTPTANVIPFPTGKARRPGCDPMAAFLRREAEKFEVDPANNEVQRKFFVMSAHKMAAVFEQARGNLERYGAVRQGDASAEAKALVYAEYKRIWSEKTAESGKVKRSRNSRIQT